MTNNININGQNVSMEDIQAALAAQGLDIRELAKQAKALQRGEIVNPEKTAPVSHTTYQLALVNYPDFCIERNTAKTKQLIVIMPSCQGYYVKYIRGKDEFIEELTPELYSKFTAGMNSLELPADFWIRKVESGKQFGAELLVALKNKTYVEMIKYKVAPKFENLSINSRWNSSLYHDWIKTYEKYPALFREFFNSNKARTCLINSQAFMNALIDKFDLNNARDFLAHLELSLVEIRDGYYCGFNGKLPMVEMEYKAFRDYILYQSVFMGYGKNIGTFMNEWSDSISMQQSIYGKIKEKYHDDLPLWHHQLSYKSQVMKEQTDDKKMQEMVELASLYQGTSGQYVFIAPKCKQDFLDEAQMQQNCLASYVKRFSDGECIIMFMRKKKDPTQSLVTIEIRKDDDGNYTVLNQKYQARNRSCTAEQEDAINKWLKRAINRVNKKLKGEDIEVDEELTKILETLEQE